MSIVTTVNDIESILTIKISGEFNFEHYKEFINAYENTKGDYKKYIIDMTDVTYADSAAFGMLKQLREYVSSSKESICISHYNSTLRDLFKMANFQIIFDFDPPLN